MVYSDEGKLQAESLREEFDSIAAGLNAGLIVRVAKEEKKKRCSI